MTHLIQTALMTSLTELLWLTLAFGLVGKLVVGKADFNLLPGGRQDWLLNVTYLLFDAAFVLPAIYFLNAGLHSLMQQLSISGLFSAPLAGGDSALIFLLALMLADFVGYWRHRLMHSRLLWPIHAAHHSDKNLSWLSLLRFHPVNRLIAAGLDTVVLGAVGFPVWAIAASNLVRHFYGYFVHADLPWTFGPLEKLFVSPVMHRWHHSVVERAYKSNFATVFALYDWVFGTWYVPHKDVGELGESIEGYPTSWFGQFFYPLRAWGLWKK